MRMLAYGVGSLSGALQAARIEPQGSQEKPGVISVLCFWCLLGKLGGYKICTAVIAATDFEHGDGGEMAALPAGE